MPLLFFADMARGRLLSCSQAQLDEFREAFSAYDRDGGGSIDAKELKALMASVGQVPSDDELQEMIRIADADGSGEVDFYEFVTLMAHKMADVRRRRANIIPPTIPPAAHARPHRR